MDNSSANSDDLDLPDTCQTCNQRAGSPYRLVLDTGQETKNLDIVLCDTCARELTEEDWIEALRE